MLARRLRPAVPPMAEGIGWAGFRRVRQAGCGGPGLSTRPGKMDKPVSGTVVRIESPRALKEAWSEEGRRKRRSGQVTVKHALGSFRRGARLQFFFSLYVFLLIFILAAEATTHQSRLTRRKNARDDIGADPEVQGSRVVTGLALAGVRVFFFFFPSPRV